MTPQEVYDGTVRFLFTQGGPSLGSGETCAYRGYNGRKCAIGFWIPDDHYHQEIESCGVCLDGKTVNSILAPYVPVELHEHAPLLHELQKGHDRAYYVGAIPKWVTPWDTNNGIAHILEWIAGRFNLNTGVVYACWPKTKENVA